MYCSKCGRLNPEEAVFCSDCGNRLETLSAEPVAKSSVVEVEIKNGSANYYIGMVGGKLYLTNKRLRFKSYELITREMEIPLNQIVRIEKATFQLVFKQINVFLKDGSVEKFVGNNREEWINAIMKQKNQ